MTYELNEYEVVVRLNNDEGVNELDIFCENVKLDKKFTIEWIADSLIYVSYENCENFSVSDDEILIK